MDELVIFVLICTIVPTIIATIYWPHATAVGLFFLIGGGVFWLANKRKQIGYDEEEDIRRRRLLEHPEINSVYIPSFDNRFRSETKNTKKMLKSRDLNDILTILESIEKMVEEKIIPRKELVLESLHNYLREDKITILTQIDANEKLLQEANREERKLVLQQTIKSLQEKLRVLEQSKEEIIYFYSYINNIFLQIENMRLKSTQLTDKKKLLIDLKHDLNSALENFSDANSLLDEITKIC